MCLISYATADNQVGDDMPYVGGRFTYRRHAVVANTAPGDIFPASNVDLMHIIPRDSYTGAGGSAEGGDVDGSSGLLNLFSSKSPLRQY